MKQAGRAQGALQTVTAASPVADLIAYYGGPASDVYFQRARTTLAGAHVDAVVAMDFFSSKAGVLCGVAEAVRLLSGILREGDQAWAVAEGAAMEKKETVLRVRAPYSRFGVYETALLGMLSSCSGWATAAREIVEAAGGKRVISFGARHVHPLIAPTMEYSAVVGGCAGCATPLGAQLAGLQGASGTMPHAMILLFGDTVKAALAFDEETTRRRLIDSLLVAAGWNVGANGDAFGVANNSNQTILDLLLRANAQAVNGKLYNGNSARRTMAINVFDAINQAGDI